ncbi:hypothetical protein [Azospira restricta]|uniref:IrrE N-terminal-like domain-containing protein n=1 Tax=Azospira restricta TaxID=404405 RepID=A0A974PXD1_9RHOO|nr:hypothetical protein [Azospira restricta]QRJ62735.1 hypothetical protein IWH25_13275 [Azospira restricta]
MRKRLIPLWGWWAVGGLCVAVPAALAGTDPLAGEAKAGHERPAIRVAPANWGSADPRDVQALLDAVAAEFHRHAAPPGAPLPAIRVMPRGGAPRVLYERGPGGEYVVHLSARNENWFQYAYQFAHELCHIYSHFDRKAHEGDEPASANQWFEEALCETAALFTLERLAARWGELPPTARWAGYAPVLAGYAAFLQGQAHRRLAPAQPLAGWYREHAAALRDNPYLRDKNEVVANALLPLFAENPASWRAIAYLNPDAASAAKDFADFLGDWYAACPDEQRETVRRTMALFGFAPPAAPQRLSRAPATTE